MLPVTCEGHAAEAGAARCVPGLGHEAAGGQAVAGADMLQHTGDDVLRQLWHSGSILTGGQQQQQHRGQEGDRGAWKSWCSVGRYTRGCAASH